MSIRFDNQVAVVTGSGRGLGRSYAILLANRGAKVVVNDLGSSVRGDGNASNIADKVVQQIAKNGGIAIADYHSVEQGDKIIQTAIDKFGRIDILINNAGIVRDVSFQKMTIKDWELMINVHLNGSFRCTKAAWNFMRKQQYGRIINTSSSTGMYGAFGMANYGSAKMALHGLTRTLAIQGQAKNININTIAPYAASRMMEIVLSEDMLKTINPQLVAPFVCYLCHPQCKQNGNLYELGGGIIKRVRWQRNEGIFLDQQSMNIESIKKNFDKINKFAQKSEHPQTADEILKSLMQLKNSKL